MGLVIGTHYLLRLSGMKSRNALLLTALFSLLSVASFYTGLFVPLLTFPLMCFYAFPALYITKQHGIVYSAIWAFITSALLTVSFGAVFSLIFICSFGAAGVLLGLLARRVTDSVALLVNGVALSLAAKLAAVLLIYAITGVSLLSPDVSEVETAVRTFFAGTPLGAGWMQSGSDINAAIQHVIMLIPFSIILFTAIEVLACYSLASKLARRASGSGFFALPPMSGWSFPKNILVALLVSFVCELLAQRDADYYFLRQIGANLGALLRVLFIVQGLAVASFFLRGKALVRIARPLLIVLAVLVGQVGDIFSIAGIIDIGFDLRKRFGGNVDESNSDRGR